MNRPAQKTLQILFVTAAASALATSFASCSNPPAKSTDAPQAASGVDPVQASWQAKMRALSATLSDLLPLVSSRPKFNDPQNTERVDQNTRQLRALAHSLKTAEAPNQDPAMRFVSGLFEQDIDRAVEALRSGNREYARRILKDTTSYCIQCHTQTSQGTQFPRFSLDVKTSELTSLELAEFYAAIRQFDSALAAYEAALANPSFSKADPFEWQNAARSALAIIVRVKNDPKPALQLLTQIDARKDLPTKTREAIATWKKSVLEWQRRRGPEPKNQKEALARAEALIQSAQQRQDFPLDHAQDIRYFRASALLHELLQKGSDDKALSAKAMYLAGTAAEATRDMNFWTLHETYYENCIRAVPHTKQAVQCFARLKESITLGYSGSGGVRIPPEILKRLEGFEALAKAKAP